MATSQPNILFITTDEHRADAVGYTNPAVKTPNIDALAKESVCFTRAYSSNPSCVPSRAAMMTGRWPSQCGVPTYITYLPETETTFMNLLQHGGYYTAAIGKQDFGESTIERGYHYEEINDIMSPNSKRCDLNHVTELSPSYTQFLSDAGFTSSSQFHEPMSRFSFRWTVDLKYHVDHFIGERAKRWLLHGRPRRQPWFLWVSFPGPHQPFNCAGTPYAEQYNPDNIDMPHTQSEALDSKPPHFRAHVSRGMGGLSNDEIRAVRHAYYANITFIDDKIGQILQILKTIGEYENTMIAFSADHGEFLGDFGLIYKGQYLSEVLMRVPLLIKPSIDGFKGWKEDAFVSNVDVAATCLQAAGLDVPTNMASRDLSPYWKNPDAVARSQVAYMEAGGLRGLRTDRWKIVHYPERPYGELYDLTVDPWESHNLWDDPSYFQERSELAVTMMDQMISRAPRSNVKWSTNAPPI